MKLIPILGLLALINLSACGFSGPPMPKQPVKQDTIPARDTIIKQDTVQFKIMIEYKGGLLYVKQNNFGATIPIQNVELIKIGLTPFGELAFFTANDKKFIDSYAVQEDKYKFNDSGDVIFQKGNTITQLCVDLDITLEQIKRLNPNLDINKVKRNQIIHISPQ